MDLRKFDKKRVNVILKNMHLLVVILHKIPLLPLWRVGGRVFTKRNVSRIYEAEW